MFFLLKFLKQNKIIKYFKSKKKVKFIIPVELDNDLSFGLGSNVDVWIIGSVDIRWREVFDEWCSSIIDIDFDSSPWWFFARQTNFELNKRFGRR